MPTTTRSHERRALGSVVSAQFFSTLADNALLFVAIGLLLERQAAAWMVPALRLFFYVSFVLLAAFGGAVADAQGWIADDASATADHHTYLSVACPACGQLHMLNPSTRRVLGDGDGSPAPQRAAL